MSASLIRSNPASSCSRAARTCSASATRTCSVIGPNRAPDTLESGWWIGDHRREIRFGGEFAVDARATGELADARPLLDELDVEPEQDARLDRLTELRAFDRHEIDELARPGE